MKQPQTTAPFVLLEDAHVVLFHKGVYAPANVFVNARNEVFFQWSRGFIRPRKSGDTSMDKVFWRDLTLPAGKELSYDGYKALLTASKKKRTLEPAE